MQERIKSMTGIYDAPCTQTSAVSEYANKIGHHPLWNEAKFIDRDSHWYTRRVQEATHVRLHPVNINRDNGIEILEAWMPTIKQHNSSVPSGPQRKQCLNRTMGIEMHQSQTAMVLHIVTHAQFTLSPDEDQQ